MNVFFYYSTNQKPRYQKLYEDLYGDIRRLSVLIKAHGCYAVKLEAVADSIDLLNEGDIIVVDVSMPINRSCKRALLRLVKTNIPVALIYRKGKNPSINFHEVTSFVLMCDYTRDNLYEVILQVLKLLRERQKETI